MTGIYYSGLLQLPDFGEALCRLCCLFPPGRLVTVLIPGIRESPVNRQFPIAHVMQLGLCPGVKNALAVKVSLIRTSSPSITVVIRSGALKIIALS